MTTTPHTSGPWNLHHAYKGKPLFVTGCDGESWISWERIIAQGDMFIGSVQATTAPKPGWPRVTNPLEMEANARLIAAAPEMLAALEAITSNTHIDLEDLVYNVRDDEGLGWEGPAVRQWSEAVTSVKEAIRKAKGEA